MGLFNAIKAMKVECSFARINPPKEIVLESKIDGAMLLDEIRKDRLAFNRHEPVEVFESADGHSTVELFGISIKWSN